MPKTIKIGYEHAIVSDDLLVFDPNGPLKNYKDAMSASFTWPSGKIPGSILVNKGKAVCGSACHAWLGYPESVIYRYKDGTFGYGRYKYDTEIPDRANVLWAVGGVGLIGNYKPSVEGFAKFYKNGKYYNYTDVLRKTAHTVIAMKAGKCYQIYIHSMSAYQINLWVKAQGFELAIIGDGGHIPAINGSTAECKHNLYIEQGFATQGIDYPVAPPTTTLKKKIFIGVGHGGSDSGAVANGLNEKDVNLVMALALNAALIKQGYITLLSRTSDVYDPLVDEIKECNAFKPDIAIGIHNNAGGGDGFEAFRSIVGTDSLKLALLCEKYAKALGQNSRGVKTRLNSYGKDYYGFLREIYATSIIIETAFLDNVNDVKAIDTKAEQGAFGVAYAKAVVEYFGKTWIA